jgi:membrane protease YdiL (CAAX protease family)
LGLAVSFVAYHSLIWNILSGQATDDMTNLFVFVAGYSFLLNLLLEIMYIFIFLTLSEEVLFRGFLQGTLETKISRSQAVLVQATIFGLLHVGIGLPYLPLIHCIIYGTSAVMAAITFGAVFAWRKGNLAACWIAHGTVNSIVAAIVMISIAFP